MKTNNRASKKNKNLSTQIAVREKQTKIKKKRKGRKEVRPRKKYAQDLRNIQAEVSRKLIQILGPKEFKKQRQRTTCLTAVYKRLLQSSFKSRKASKINSLIKISEESRRKKLDNLLKKWVKKHHENEPQKILDQAFIKVYQARQEGKKILMYFDQPKNLQKKPRLFIEYFKRFKKSSQKERNIPLEKTSKQKDSVMNQSKQNLAITPSQANFEQKVVKHPQNKSNCSRKDDTTLQKKHSKEIRHPYGPDRTFGDFSNIVQNQQKFPCKKESIFDIFDFNPPYWKYVTPQQI